MTPAIFDLGNVLMEYEPRRLFGKFFPEPEELEWFLDQVVTSEWNDRLDCGWSFAEGVADLVARHPAHEEPIRAFRERWLEMIGDPIHSNVFLLEELRLAGVPLFALSNFSAETWPLARPLFPFLEAFDGILISGEVGFGKPDPAFFRLLATRHGFGLEGAVFVDDNPSNVQAASRLGMKALHYQGDPHALRNQLGEVYPFLTSGVSRPPQDG
jgi:2-haloacid dehalogenase